jgi:hypothetical protein
MLSATDCRNNARQCREMAARMKRPDDRKAMELLAVAWDKVAAEAERGLKAKKEPAEA